MDAKARVMDMQERMTRVVKARNLFVYAYCAERKWDRDNLGIEQILEIREQDGWKHPDLAETV